MTDEIDLFGNPVRPGRGQRGRPRFEVTPEIRNKIKLGLALGWVNDRIAGAVGISAATLKRYFRAELKARDLARDQLDLRRFELVMAEANKGNVGAIKELGKMLERNDQMTAGRRFEAAQEQPAREKPTKALGKKEAAQLAAENAGGEGSLWGSDLTPGWRPN